MVGAKNLGNRTLNTIDNIGYEAHSWLSEKFPGAFGEPELAGIGNGLERPTPRPMQSVPEKPQPMRMQGNHEVPQGGVTKVPDITLNESVPKVPTSETAPKVPITEPGVGLSNRGYKPQPGERSMTREQWKAQASEHRAKNRLSQADQALDNPLPNASKHGHGHADHGYQTTDIQQGDRIRTGIPPSGRTNAPAVSKTSKFNSPISEAEALERGKGKLKTDIASGNIPPDKRFPDPVTGKPTYVDPTTGAPTRHKVSVTTDNPNGFGYKIVKQKDPITGQVLKDAAGQPLTIADPAKINSATVIWEYVPSQGTWHPVTYYPQ